MDRKWRIKKTLPGTKITKLVLEIEIAQVAVPNLELSFHYTRAFDSLDAQLVFQSL